MSSAIYYSKSTNGFYTESVNSSIPDDKVSITEEYWYELLEGQASGKVISHDSQGYPLLINAPVPSKEETIAIINSAIQSALDSGAQNWGYESIVSAASYYGSTNAQYNADASVLMLWRDNVWGWAYPKYPLVKPGETPTEFMVDMPVQPPKPIV